MAYHVYMPVNNCRYTESEITNSIACYVDSSMVSVVPGVHTLAGCCVVRIGNESGWFLARRIPQPDSDIDKGDTAAPLSDLPGSELDIGTNHADKSKSVLCLAICTATLSDHDQETFSKYLAYLKNANTPVAATPPHETNPESGMFKVFSPGNTENPEYTAFYILGSRIYHESIVRAVADTIIDDCICKSTTAESCVITKLKEYINTHVGPIADIPTHIKEYCRDMWDNKRSRLVQHTVAAAGGGNDSKLSHDSTDSAWSPDSDSTDPKELLRIVQKMTPYQITRKYNTTINTAPEISIRKPFVLYEYPSCYPFKFWHQLNKKTSESLQRTAAISDISDDDIDRLAGPIYLAGILPRLTGCRPNGSTNAAYAIRILAGSLYGPCSADTFATYCIVVGFSFLGVGDTCLDRVRVIVDEIFPDAKAHIAVLSDTPGLSTNARCIITNAKQNFDKYVLIAYLSDTWLFDVGSSTACYSGRVALDIGVAADSSADIVYVYGRTS